MCNADACFLGRCYGLQVIIVLLQQTISCRKKCQRGRLCYRVQCCYRGKRRTRSWVRLSSSTLTSWIASHSLVYDRICRLRSLTAVSEYSSTSVPLTRPTAPFHSINNRGGKKRRDFPITFTGPCIAKVFSEYNQKIILFWNLFTYVRRSTCFRRVFRSSSEAQYSVRHLSDRYCFLLLAWMIPFRLAAGGFVKFCARDNGRKTRLKHEQGVTETNKF